MNLKKIIKAIGGIILATKDTVKGHCGESKCTYDVYTKEKVDELLKENSNRVYVKDDYLVLEGDLKGLVFLEPTNGVIKNFDYPEGFNANNTIVISKLLNNAVSVGDYYDVCLSFRWDKENEKISYFNDITVCLTPTDIEIVVESSGSRTNWSDYAYKVVLMKYKD